jgi:hypothetical protein
VLVEILCRPAAALAVAKRGRERLLAHAGSAGRAATLIEAALPATRPRNH